MFATYRSAHEVDTERMAPLSNSVLSGKASQERITHEIRRRSRRFHLEADVASFLSPIAGEIARVYEDAKFVLTIRDCFSWLDSRIESYVALDHAGIAAPTRKARYENHDDHFEQEESPLREAGLRPLSSYLRYWSMSPTKVMGDVPSDRLCVVRTEDLDSAREALASFVGVSASSMRSVHANQNQRRRNLLGQIPREFIVDRAVEWCEPLMTEFWGADWVAMADRLPVA
jgi:hypothetical protein